MKDPRIVLASQLFGPIYTIIEKKGRRRKRRGQPIKGLVIQQELEHGFQKPQDKKLVQNKSTSSPQEENRRMRTAKQ
jgi:hypothetical protein